MGLGTKTYWLTDRQSQCDFDFDFDFEITSTGYFYHYVFLYNLVSELVENMLLSVLLLLFA
jgi:hypothetical protein